jgi:4-alpha-glucanotransferase
VYVRYPQEELFAVLTIESARSGCLVVGEDLGTVPDEIRRGMDDHGLLGMYVTQFQIPAQPGALPRPPHRSVASLNTHDTPTFAGFVRAGDIDRNLEEGLVDPEQAENARRERAGTVLRLQRALAESGLLPDHPQDLDEHDIVRAAIEWIARSEAATVLVALDDLWGEDEPHNVPGTAIDRPNWVLRWPRSLDELALDPVLRAELGAIQASRLAAHTQAMDRS